METRMGGGALALLFCWLVFVDGANHEIKHVYDKLAPIGQLFTFDLPADSFYERAKDFKVTEAGSDVLPDWLLWEPANRTLYGVPNHRDYLPVPKYLISVTAMGRAGQKISKIITITVVQDGSVTTGGGNRPFRNQLETPQKMCHFEDTSLIMVAFPAAYFLPPEKRPRSPASFNDPRSNFELLKKATEVTSFEPSRVRLLDVAYVTELERLGREKIVESDANSLGQAADSALLFILGCGDLYDVDVKREAARLTARLIRLRPSPNDDDVAPPATTMVAHQRRPFGARLVVPLPRKRWAFDGDVVLSQWSGSGASFTTQETDAVEWTPTMASVVKIVDADDDDDDDEEEEEDDVTGDEVDERTTTEWSTSRKTRRQTSATPRTPFYTVTRRSSPHVAGLVDGITSQHRTTTRQLQYHTDRETIPSTKSTRWTSFDSTLPTSRTFDHRPRLRYSLRVITCNKNILCEVKIPKHTFSDEEDGSTEKLNLRLNMIKGPVPESKSWLLLNPAKQLLVGIPMIDGTWAYQLTATNSAGNSITDAFEVRVVRPSYADDDHLGDPSHEFAVGLSLPYATFADDLDKQALFVRRLAQNLGDGADSSNVRLNALAADPHNASLTVVRWTNATLADRAAAAVASKRRGDADGGTPTQSSSKPDSDVVADGKHAKTTASSKGTDGPSSGIGATTKSGGKVGASSDLCSRDEVDAVLKVQQTKLFRDRMNAKLFPFVYVLKTLAKWCDGDVHTAVQFPTEPRSPGSSGPLAADNLFLATILPAIIVLALLCLALLVACLLYHKSRRAKKSAAGDSPSGRSSGGGDARFLSSKGAPVIFPDEVLDTDQMVDDEKTSAHTPMLLKDEKPPLAPPDFGRLNGLSGSLGNGFNRTATADRQSSASPYPAGYQSPLSGAKLAHKQRSATAAPSFDETEMAAAQRPLLQQDQNVMTTTTMVDENPLYKAPSPFVDPHHSKHQLDGRTPTRNAAASPQTRQPPPFVSA